MDERDLKELFRDAPGEPPPPRFTAADVAAASRRATARRRNTIAGVAAAVVVLAGGTAGILGAVLSPGQGESASQAQAPAMGEASGDVRGQEQPGPSQERPLSTDAEGFPRTSPKQGGEASGEAGRQAGSTSGCDKVDRELATALAGELPVTAETGARPGRVCPTGSRSAGFPVDGGTITAVLVPGRDVPSVADQPEGTRTAHSATAGGGTVLVVSTPADGAASAPLAGDLDRIAVALARRF
ncbi:hypothetical protein [Prauserella muralis]|uniref:Uncharacterized protein n=1 Tax=Prauserella muralis TaxID=588067 RepID=A0A2V4B7U8_9PSEU|nr:hypothetical protein [Prauserella muralis]PXY31465.1 hypothetical protein BAY60_03550 [Prauserella muralis]TWE14192.1 hypothetical protein FHX69_6330 [Prauserella muralis]